MQEIEKSLAEKRPDPQETQSVAEDILFVKDPALHVRQLSERGTGAYLPLSQFTQIVSLKLYCPASQ